MGKGTIVSGGSDGLYTVRLNYNRTRVTKQISELRTKAAALTTEIGRMDAYIATLEPQIEAKRIELSRLEAGSKDWIAKYKEFAVIINHYSEAVARKNVATLQLTACNKRIDYLTDTTPDDYQAALWCCDLTEDLAAGLVVGTVEIPGEPQAINIQPGWGAAAAYQPARDGQVFPSVSCTPAGVFYNLALMPGWQRWMPTHRYGTITEIDRVMN